MYHSCFRSWRISGHGGQYIAANGETIYIAVDRGLIALNARNVKRVDIGRTPEDTREHPSLIDRAIDLF
jgi:hypothetical protein